METDTGIKVMTEEAIREAYARNDMNVVNGVLSGTITVGDVPVEGQVVDPKQGYVDTGELVEQSDTDVTSVSEQSITETPSETRAPEEGSKLEIDALRLKEELDQKQNYIQTLEERHQQEREELLLKQREADKKLESMLAEQERIKKELEARQSQPPPQPVTVEAATEEDDDSEEYASDYSKKNRALIQELRGALDNNSTSAEINKVLDKINEIEARENEKLKLEQERKKREEAESKKKRMFEEIHDFQRAHDGFQTEVSIDKIDGEFIKFKQDLAWFMGTGDSAKVDSTVNEILFGQSEYANKLRNDAKEKGIVPPKGIEKYMEIARLVDLRNGYETDATTGQVKEVTDSFGNRVRYRSLEEAYRLSNYYDEVNKARRDAAKEFQNVLQNREDSAVTIDNRQTAHPVVAEGMTEDIKREYINMSAQQAQARGPDFYKQYQEVWRSLGLEPPVAGGSF